MPTVLRYKGYRFHFFSDEGREPPHVHIRKAECTCKFWLQPVSLAYNDGMKAKELTELKRVVEENRNDIERKWHEYFA